MALSRDARLVARVRRGDSSAFEALHARYEPAILAFCRHLTGNVEDAEDAVQHTFLAAYRRIVDSPDALELRPWLFAVARNRSLSLLRARRESVVADPDAAPATFDGLAGEVERRQELRDLVDDMSRLPESQRAALVLSQLDALSYREIGSVLEVPPEKVKALVFQARSSLASTREAREAPCFEIRSEIATARGSGLRRRLLRRHVGQCDGCREFEVTVMRQRRDLAILLPVAPSAGLGPAILEAALGREGAATVGTGGTAAATGGAGGAGLAGTLAALGGGGAAKLAVVAALAGGATATAVAADLPDRIQPSAAIGVFGQAGSGSEAGAPPARGDGGAGGGTGGSQPPADGERPGSADGPAKGDAENGSPRSAARADGPAAGEVAQGEEAGAPGASEHGDAGEPGESERGDDPAAGADPPGLPPGLGKRDQLPHGLAKREELPPGLAKGRNGEPPGNGRGQGNGNGNAGGGSDGDGNGNGGGAGNAGAGQGNGGGGNAGGQGNGGAGGGSPPAESPGAGQGGGAPPAPAGGEPGNSGGGDGGGQGNGNACGGSPGAGQGNGNGNGNGKPK
jgi:RNA polymerase sigma factor (sigma-70 family)